MTKLRSMILRTTLLVSAFLSACNAKDAPVEEPPPPPPTTPPPTTPPPAAPTCIADAPVCSSACGTGFSCTFAAGLCNCTQDQPPPPPPPTDVLARHSRSTPVDITSDDQLVAMVNTDDGSISFFNVTFGSESRSAKIATSAVAGSEPISVVIHPNRTEAFVANRAAGTVSRIVDINTTQPRLTAEVAVGAEPMGIALTPKGGKAYVTDWVSGTVVVVDTAAMRVDQTINVGGSPFALVITNDLDQDESDETVLVTQFFARARAGVAIAEGVDDGKEGVVQLIRVGATSVAKEITLAPITSCFTGNAGNPPAEITSACFPNQLASIAVHKAFGKTRAYVVSTAASPEGPISFNHNVQAVVSVIDLETEAEVVELTQNLNQLIKQQIDNDNDENLGRRFMNSPNGIDFVNRDDVAIAYVTSAGSDIVLRAEYTAEGQLSVGAGQAFNIPAGQNPQGLVVKHGGQNGGAFVANLISRDLSVLLFRDQRELKKILSTEQPANGSAEFRAWKGKRFFNTSTGIWSKEGWGSCQGCHPMGLTDNVTWKFGAGPRQTVSMDGQFASNDPTDMRALNWTAVFDELHDFEGNVRGTSGGLGAIQNAQGAIVSTMTPNFVSILVEDGTTRENHQALNGSLKFITRSTEICSNSNVCPDWDLVDAYVQSIRSPRGKIADTAVIAGGRALYEEAGCNKCHAGPKWTISSTFYKPEEFTGSLGSRVFEANRAATTAMDPGSLRGLPLDVVLDATLIAGDDSDMGTPALKRQACNIRNVKTFGVEGGADETRENGTPAQGRNGFNVPSLLSVNIGAPYFHNGSAASLNDILDVRYESHTKAGNPNFNPNAAERAELFAFLASIDETTDVFPIDPTTVLCPTGFTP